MVRVKTGCVSKQTFVQGVALGLVGGPMVYLIQGGSLWWCMTAMFIAPFLVDAIRPVVVIS